MTRPHPEIVATARLVERYATTYQTALNVLDQQWATLDWHPAGGGEHVTSSPESSPVEAALERKLALESDYAQLDDDRTTIAALVHSALTVANEIANRIPAERPDVPRCNGTIYADCTEAASDHRDRNGSEVPGLCDSCFLASCRECHKRPIVPGRYVIIDDHRLPACEVCYKRGYRQGQRHTTGAA